MQTTNSVLLSKGRFSVKDSILSVIMLTAITAPVYFLFREAFDTKYVQLGLLLVGVFLSVFAMFGIYMGGRELTAIDIYNDHITIKWAWGAVRLKIMPANITLYSISKVNKYDCIVLRTSRDYIIPIGSISNIEELKVQLKQWQVKRRDSLQYDILSRTQKKMIGLLCAVVGMAILVIIATGPYPEYKPVDSKDLVLLRGHLHASPGIIKPGGRSHAKGVNFFLDEYPGFTFSIGSDGYDAADLNTLKDFKQGAAAAFAIYRREFDIKIANTAEPNFEEKHFGWDRIGVYQASLNGSLILSLDNYNASHLKNYSVVGTIIAIGVGLLLTGYGLRAFLKKR